MQKQNFELKNEKIRKAFLELKQIQTDKLQRRLNLSWSNWGFGMESLADSAARLQQAGLEYIELHGNHYGPELGYKADETLKILGDHNLKVAGVCGMFSADNDVTGAGPIVGSDAVCTNHCVLESAFRHEVGKLFTRIFSE